MSDRKAAGQKSALEVRERREVTADVVQLRLGCPDGTELPSWEPGAHVDLHLPNGLTRQYSLCGSPDDGGSWTVAVMNAEHSRGGSSSVWSDLSVGTRLEVSAPRNNFPLVAAQRYVFVAGGIGITPLLPMMHSLAARGADWNLVYGGRRRSSMAFAQELSERYGDRVRLVPEDENGLIDLPATLGEPDPTAAVYVCGPEGMIAAAEKAAARWPAGALRVERFAASSLADSSETGPFVVALRGGRHVPIPAGVSILETLRANGFDLVSSCEAGTCGTCEVAVLAGEPDHRDEVLDDDEKAANTAMMICVSRSRSPVLELDL